MNKHKRLLSLVLVAAMVFGMFPMTASAEDENTGHIETCAGDCTGEACTCTCHQPAVVDDEPVDTCENCGQPDCTGCDGTVAQTEGETEPAPGCTVCGQAEGHLQTCSQYVAPTEETTEPATSSTEKTTEPTTVPTEETTEPSTEATQPSTGATEPSSEATGPAVLCGKCEATLAEDGKTVVHAQGCTAVCNCTPTGDVHQPYCNLYVVPKCSHCGVELTEGAVHGGNCPQYVAEGTENDAPQVGDKIWIKSGSKLYKGTDDTDGYAIKLPYHVKVKEIKTLGETVWYQFEFADLSAIIGSIFLKDYKWVKAENTSVEEPTEPEETVPSCDCINPPEDLSLHADSCPRKIYVETLFEGKTAEEIYADWESYDEDLRLDILNMVKAYDEEMYEELDKLVNGVPDSEQEVAVGDTDILVQGIPESVTLDVTNVSEDQYHSSLEKFIDKNSELLYAFDITLTNPDGSVWQPRSGQIATVTLDFNGMGLVDGNVLHVLHEHDGGLRSLGEYFIEDGKLTFTTDGFSKFYFYITYTFGGQSFTMSGGSTVRLSEILRELGISYSVSEVTNVHFTNSDVLKITRVGSDWELESLKPFGSEETLTITFVDGEVIEITVKDPVIYNYAVGENITNIPLLPTKQHTVQAVDNGDNAAIGQTYSVNSTQITVDNVKTAGAAEKEKGKHPAPDTVHMIIYAKEGMAIDFIGGTDWTYAGSKPTAAGNEIWFWSWESSVKANYVVVKDGTTGKQAKFTVTTTVDGTKYYCNVLLCVVANSSPTKLAGNLPSGYSIKNVPVTLYNYDGKTFNQNYENGGGNYFAFHGVSKGNNAREDLSNFGWASPSGEAANAGGGVAMMGIVKDQLVNGLPVMSQGQNVDLFSTNQISGKTVYDNVQFQFVYDDDTGYYTYNSALNHAQYNNSNNTIELYKQSLGPSDTPNGDAHGNAGFYPFEDINKAYTNTGYTAINDSQWEAKLKNYFELTPAQYAADIALTSSTNPASTVDLNYGIQIASDFYMPKGKKLNGEEMVYKFTGDDDLWVFIDGKLVLDIGGGHTHVSGSFNLTTGEVWVEKYTKLDAASGGSYSSESKGTDLRYTDTFLTGLKDDQMHTIQIFYLERHSGVSNCYMRFNLPLVPSDAVNVSKNLVNQDGEDLSVTPDVGYTFAMYTAPDNDDNCDAAGFTVYAGKPYTVTGAGAPAGTQHTDDKGQFTLKDGWIASFQGISRFTNVYVIESKPDDGYIYTKSTVSVNKADATEYTFGEKTETKVMQLNSSINFDFVNYMKTQPLTVEKQVVNGQKGLINSDQEFDFTLDFTKDIIETGEGAISASNQSNDAVALTDGGVFQLGHSEKITIPKVPVNMTFTLQEANPDEENSSFDAPKFESAICTTEVTPNAFDTAYSWTMGDNGENKITVINQQRFNLTITKKGISDVDHDEDERQSTLYTVIGKIDDEVLVEMNVAICGNDSVTICKLPVGSYTVTEEDDWSWRYTPDTETKEIDIPEDAKASVTYQNTRTDEFWLSGDSYCENWWGGDNGTVVCKDKA